MQIKFFLASFHSYWGSQLKFKNLNEIVLGVAFFLCTAARCCCLSKAKSLKQEAWCLVAMKLR